MLRFAYLYVGDCDCHVFLTTFAVTEVGAVAGVLGMMGAVNSRSWRGVRCHACSRISRNLRRTLYGLATRDYHHSFLAFEQANGATLLLREQRGTQMTGVNPADCVIGVVNRMGKPKDSRK